MTRAELVAVIKQQWLMHDLGVPTHMEIAAVVNVAMAYGESVREPCGCDAMPSEAHEHAVAAHAALLDAHAQGVAHGAAMADERWRRRIKELEGRADRARDALDGVRDV